MKTKKLGNIECLGCKKRFYDVRPGSYYCDFCGSLFDVDDENQISYFKKNRRNIIFHNIWGYSALCFLVVYYILTVFYKDQYKFLEMLSTIILLILLIACLIKVVIVASRHGMVGTRSIVEPMIYRNENPNLFRVNLFLNVVIVLTFIFLVMRQWF